MLLNTMLGLLYTFREMCGILQGPQSNFDIGGGGGGTISASILRGTRQIFVLTLHNFKNIWGHMPHTPPPYFVVPVLAHLPTNGSAKKCDLRISYTATFIYCITFVRKTSKYWNSCSDFNSYFDIYRLLILKLKSQHTSCAKHNFFTTHY